MYKANRARVWGSERRLYTLCATVRAVAPGDCFVLIQLNEIYLVHKRIYLYSGNV